MDERHTILVVDDEPDVAQSVRDLLRREYRVLCASSAAEGIEILQHEEVHLVMTDQRMPEMSGVEFLHRIRGAHPEAIRLLFTGYADIRAVIDAINQGNVFRYITKPWDPTELLTIIREAAQRYEMAAALKQRIFFESALRRYLAGPVIEQLIRDPSRLCLGGEKRDVSVLFFDVVDFTSLAEELTVEELVQVVNAYLDKLVDAIFRSGGTLDKFIGDAVMCFWGAPLACEDHARRACQAAVDMQRALRAFAAEQTDPRLRALRGRVGINSGLASLGNLGSSSIMSYTAMGDTVNVASRVESINKLYGSEICATGETVERAGWSDARELDLVRVKGRARPVALFELWGADGEGAPPADARAAYAEGLALYRARRFVEARAAFERARTLGDRPCAALMGKRAAELAASPPPDGWDGAHNMTDK